MSKILSKQQIFKIMRVTITQLLMTIMVVSMAYAHPTKAQDMLQERVNLNLKNGSMKGLIQSIEKQVDVTFSYQKGVLTQDEKINLSLSNETLENVMKKVFAPRNIKYQFQKNNQIILEKAKLGEIENFNAEVTPQATMEFFVADRSISGKVTDDKGDALPGVSIRLKNSSKGVATNASGQFSISIPEKGNAILVFSFVGFQTQEVSLGNQTQLQISMIPSAENLTEVVS